jgi:hypothetical protein
VRKLSNALCLIALATIFATPPSAASPESFIVRISKLIATESEIVATYQIPSGCLLESETLLIRNSRDYSITEKYYAAPGEVLNALVIGTIDRECANPAMAAIKTRTFPNLTGYKNIIAFQLGAIWLEAATQTQRSIRFVAVIRNGKGYPNEYNIEELNFVAGQPLKRTVLADQGITAILGQNAEGLIVTTYRSNAGYTWLVTTKKWQLLSNKVIYIEPGVLTPDNRFLIGRKNSDGPSSKILSQDLKTGSLTTLFETNKHGKGFVCGAYSEPTGKFAYFSHISTKNTNVYRIDLKTRKTKLLGSAKSGFCISSVTPSGRLAGIVRDEKNYVKGVLIANEKNPAIARYISTADSPIDVSQTRIFYDAMPSTLVTDDLFALLDPASGLFLFDLSDEIGGDLPDAAWEGPIAKPSSTQFIRLLPYSWQKTEDRAPQP